MNINKGEQIKEEFMFLKNLLIDLANIEYRFFQDTNDYKEIKNKIQCRINTIKRK